MLSQSYLILLEGKKIGTTSLEKADVPMGVVFGKINFIYIESGYSFFKEYCLKNGIIFEDYPEAKLISTNNIPNLKVFETDGLEIKGLSNSISGMETDGFEITILGIPGQILRLNFPQHIKDYGDI